MSLAVRDRIGPADVVTICNAVIGLGAMAAAVLGEVQLVARLILLAAVADGLDGIIARTWGGTEIGPYLDSMADIVSFGTTPALFVFVIAHQEWGAVGADPELYAAAIGVAAVFLAFSLLRTALYTVFVGEGEKRPGIQNTLASSIIAAAYLAGLTLVPAILGVTVILSLAMVAPVPYPKLAARDALVMGVVQMAAILAPTALDRVFPRVLLIAALAYMLLAPKFYWEDSIDPDAESA